MKNKSGRVRDQLKYPVLDPQRESSSIHNVDLTGQDQLNISKCHAYSRNYGVYCKKFVYQF